MGFLSADDFLTGIMGEPIEHEVPGLGTVQVRPLTMVEVVEIRKAAADNDVMLPVLAVAKGLVQPALSAEQVQRLSQAKAGPVADLADVIMRISGMSSGADSEDEAAKN